MFHKLKKQRRVFKEINNLSKIAQLVTCGVRIQTQMSVSKVYAFITLVTSLKDLGEIKLEK